MLLLQISNLLKNFYYFHRQKRIYTGHEKIISVDLLLYCFELLSNMCNIRERWNVDVAVARDQ